jgi:hypothetical protein
MKGHVNPAMTGSAPVGNPNALRLNHLGGDAVERAVQQTTRAAELRGQEVRAQQANQFLRTTVQAMRVRAGMPERLPVESVGRRAAENPQLAVDLGLTVPTA